jgi:trehalose 6-phosphate phosphatase
MVFETRPMYACVTGGGQARPIWRRISGELNMDDAGLMPERHAATAPPAPQKHWALFLDLDGTLLDIAATPRAVVVPGDLVADLEAAAATLGGALAIVSGRDIREVDTLLYPLRLPAAGEHGAIVRLPDGARDEVTLKVPDDWAKALYGLQETCPGVWTELKSHNVVVHYRNAPAHEAAVRRVASELVARDPQSFELLEAKMAVEIRPRAVTKARAVDRLMEVEPFAGRTPVFIGDDATDRDGFGAAIERGGIALDVAVFFAGRPRDVRAWLKRVAQI